MSDFDRKVHGVLLERDRAVAASAGAVGFSRARVVFAEMCLAEMERCLDAAGRAAILRVMERIPEIRPDERLSEDLEKLMPKDPNP